MYQINTLKKGGQKHQSQRNYKVTSSRKQQVSKKSDVINQLSRQSRAKLLKGAKMKKNFYVYHLVSNGKTIYVGLTSTPTARFSCHLSCAKTKSSPLYSYLKNNKVEMKLVSVHSSKMEGSIAEIAEIMSLKNDGVFLFNIEAGGLKFKKLKQPEFFNLQKSLAKAA